MQNLAAPPWLVEGPQWRGTIKARLDIFWLRDETLEESANLPAPDVIAADIVEGLEAALEQFREIAADLGADAATEIDRECPGTEVRLRNLPLDSG
jgi:type I restriction enzyme M protein